MFDNLYGLFFCLKLAFYFKKLQNIWNFVAGELFAADNLYDGLCLDFMCVFVWL